MFYENQLQKSSEPGIKHNILGDALCLNFLKIEARNNSLTFL